ncbi:MAG: sigma-70 family RNA polymerase sigma factor [Pirellulaceae bacterium]|jgi:RNA polymerase sigma-70 factor, ECF subfamily|nr:sigma-70 family RNA polymerase sigma factor [Pirellulaceae bacterium]
MWPEQDETLELLRQAGGGDDRAVNDLMDRHREALRQMVRMRLDQRIKKRVDVSDVVQDVLIEANRRLGDYIANPVMSFRLWLRQIAKDRIIDAHRRHRVSARRSVDREQTPASPRGLDKSSIQLAALLNDKQLTPAEKALQKEMAKRVEQAILELEEKDSEIIVMRHYEHLTNQEVAAALSLTEPAASMRYLRALRRLKAILQDGSNSIA